jgi:hypothetical protein
MGQLQIAPKHVGWVGVCQLLQPMRFASTFITGHRSDARQKAKNRHSVLCS